MAGIRTAVIPVAGRGTRLQPITRAIPKELLPIVDRPMIEYVVREALEAGIEEIILISSSEKPSIENYLSETFPKVRFRSLQQPSPLGLGHAIACARPAVKNEAFAVLLSDDIMVSTNPCIGQLMEVHNKYEGAPVVGMIKVRPAETVHYGIADGKEIQKGLLEINNLLEKPKLGEVSSCWALPGRYILSPEIFDILDEAKPSVGGEIQLTDSLDRLAKARPLYGLELEAHRFDVGNRLGLIRATLHFALSRKELRDGIVEITEEIIEKIKGNKL